MVRNGQKTIWKKIWPLCFEKDQANGLWWKFQLSSMKNGKVSIFDVAQWSKMVKSHFEKNSTTLFWKRSGKVSVVKISALLHEKWQVYHFWCCIVVKNGQKSIWNFSDHCVLKLSRQRVSGENFSLLAWKMAKLAFLMLHSGQKWPKVNLKFFWPLCFEI